MELTIFLVGSILFPLILTLYGLKKLPKWKERDFGNYNFNWKIIFTSSALTAFLVSAIVFSFTSNPWAAISVSPLAYMLVLGSVTDLRILKIPADISILAYVLPIPIMITTADSFGWISFGVWFGLIVLFTVFFLIGAFGLADLRIMILAGTSISWWVGMDNMLSAFGFSAFIQILAFPLAHKFNLGVLKPRKSVNFELKEKEKAQAELVAREQAEKDGVEYVPLHTEKKPAKPKTGFSKKMDEFVNGKSEKDKRFLPYGPALYLTFTLVAIFYSVFFSVPLEPFFMDSTNL